MPIEPLQPSLGAPDFSRVVYANPPSHDFCVFLIISELMRRYHKAPGLLKSALENKAQRIRTIKGEGSAGDIAATAAQVGMQPALTAAGMAAGLLNIP